MWLQNGAGTVAVNLDQAERFVPISDGSVDVYYNGTSVNVAGIGTDAASAAEAMRRITQAVDPADY